jgi:hypothetical protein
MTPSPDSIHQTTSTNHITPLQLDPPINPLAPRPAARKSSNFWNDASYPTEPFHMASPSPATDMRTEDFVMFRRKGGNLIEEDILEHRPLTESKTMDKKNCGYGSSQNNKGKKWVRFLDVGISCPSDESDDELAFCKPSWTKKTTGQ